MKKQQARKLKKKFESDSEDYSNGPATDDVSDVSKNNLLPEM
jgi:hypothetical protein